MRRWKLGKVLALVLALTLAIPAGILKGPSDAFAASAAWDGSADTGWYSGSLSDFTINTPKQLAGLATLVNDGNDFKGKTVRLGADLSFDRSKTWTSIASEASGKSFEGTLDGQGHTLYNLYGASLFGTIGENGIVKGVKTSGGDSTSGGGIAVQNRGWILFCVNGNSVEGSSAFSIGGICADNQNLVYGCGNTGEVGKVSSSATCGGIAGRQYQNGASIDSCWNSGDIYGDRAGGIVGIRNNGWVMDCYNRGTMYGIRWSGGLAGESGGNGGIHNCYHAGKLEGSSGYQKDTICCGEESGCENVYSVPSEYNRIAQELTVDELKRAATAQKLNGSNVLAKWCLDQSGVNDGMLIPIAQQDLGNSVYKIIPDIWYPVTAVTVNLSNGNYQLHAYSAAYLGLKGLSGVYRCESDILSITPQGLITPLKNGTATVKVMFPESEYGKQSEFDVTVTITGEATDPAGSQTQNPSGSGGQNASGGGQGVSGGQNVSGGGGQPSGSYGSWIQSGGLWWYQYSDGSYPYSGWAQIDGAWYYFDASGWMQTGWLNLGGTWYYLTGSGAMATGWISDGGTWYYLTGSGAMATGWLSDGGTWYYLTGSGAMATGWISDGGAWYYLTGSGAMATGWISDGGAWYYLTGSGAMATGWVQIGGTWYYLTGSGAMATGWIDLGGTWYYLNSDGAMAADTWIGSYYVNADGAWVA